MLNDFCCLRNDSVFTKMVNYPLMIVRMYQLLCLSPISLQFKCRVNIYLRSQGDSIEPDELLWLRACTSLKLARCLFVPVSHVSDITVTPCKYSPFHYLNVPFPFFSFHYHRPTNRDRTKINELNVCWHMQRSISNITD